MLKLKNITKIYKVDDTLQVNALENINLDFEDTGFVCILGHSGCGKTTLLNIIGGLDNYTSGDLVINDLSTKEYKNTDWDNYRNKEIGIVFQAYNLISHVSVLGNVELAMTLSGISKKEREKKAKGVYKQNFSIEKYTMSQTLDLRGYKCEEALDATEMFLDKASLVNLSPVYIIHGHGTGALKQVIRDYLMHSPYVAKFRPGEAAEGGDGVSVVDIN